MRTRTKEELEDISLRNVYQKALGKKLRASQWANFKLEVNAAFPDEEMTESLLTNIAKYKGLSPKWIVDRGGLKLFKVFLDGLPDDGLNGASLHLRLQDICRYKVSDRTIKEWFRTYGKTYDLSKNYSRQECINLGIKAMTSHPRAFSKEK